MRCRYSTIALSFVLVVPGCTKNDDGGSAAAAPPAAAVAPDMPAIAHSVVSRSLGVREGDRVVVEGSPRDLEMFEDIVLEVEKAGGHVLPMITTERMTRRSYDDVDARYDSLQDGWGKVLYTSADRRILIDVVETPDLLAHVDPARIAARARANKSASDLIYVRKIPTIYIGNDMYPTHATAARFGMTRDQLAGFFWSALTADFSNLTANANTIENAIGNAKELHITDTNGTDVRIGVARKKWYVSDGVMTSEGIKRGDFLKYLPAGELYSLIDPSSAEGTIVVDHYSYQSQDIAHLVLKVSKGRVTSMTAASGLEPLQRAYDAEKSDEKSLVSIIDFGINPGIKAAAAPNVRTWVPEGMVTISIGNDAWAGGSHNVSFNNVRMFLSKATVTADGKVIVENGVIKR